MDKDLGLYGSPTRFIWNLTGYWTASFNGRGTEQALP